MKKILHARALLIVAALLATVSLATGSAYSAATIVINNLDSAGEGFNDPTPMGPIGNNPGTTLGALRLNAFTYTANLIGQCLISPVPIIVNAQMDPLSCTPTSAILGSAGATTVHRDFAGAPLAATWYPQALANSLFGADLVPATSDINATFNSSINGNPACLASYSWYYGFDGNPAANQIDFISVVLHEILHGLGFQTFINLGTGAKLNTFNDTYMVHMRHVGNVPPDYPSMTNAQRSACNAADPNLVFNGTCVNAKWPLIPLAAGTNGIYARLHGPNPKQSGSSLSHWSTALSPNELMEPSYTGVNHSPGLALQLLKDIGWVLDPKLPVAVAISSFEARPVSRGVELTAEFLSTFDVVRVNVYRANGGSGFTAIESIVGNGSGDFTYLDATATPGQSYRYKIGVTDLDGEFFSQERAVTVPSVVSSLDQNVPNPFNPITSIRFTLAETQDLTVRIFDAGGRLVRTLLNESRAIGTHSVEWNGTDNAGNAVGSGIYFYRLDAGKFSQSRKMVLLK